MKIAITKVALRVGIRPMICMETYTLPGFVHHSLVIMHHCIALKCYQ